MDETKRCRFCGEEILAVAIKCKHCGSLMDDGPRQDLGTSPGSQVPPWAAGAARIPEGTEIREYRVLGLLGEGGMGEVYRAEHTYTGQKVAIKAVHPGLMADRNVRRRFLEEGRVMAGLKHPNIVTLHTFFEEAGRFFLIMEFIDGHTLEELLRSGSLQSEQTARIIADVLAALQYAHTCPEPVIHRDIKPANIMIDRDGRVVVTDFGIARAVGREKLTKTGGAIGTFEYMSPEQIRGVDLDHRSDLYSVGISLFQCLSGQVPFPQESDSGIECMNAHLGAQVPDLGVRGVQEPLWMVVEKALAKDPGGRFQSGREFRDALLFAVEGGHPPATSIPAPSLSASTVTPPLSAFEPEPSRRRRLGNPVWILLTCFVLLAGAGGLWWAGQARDREDPNPEPRRSQGAEKKPGLEAPTKIAEKEDKAVTPVRSACTLSCDNRACGSDGCGGSCGECVAGSVCDDGICRCVPACEDRACGGDGCGGQCGPCPAGEICKAGRCGPDPASTRVKLASMERETASMDQRVKELEETCRSRRHCYGFARNTGDVVRCAKAFSDDVQGARREADSGRISETEEALKAGERSRDDCEQLLSDLEQMALESTERGFGTHRHQQNDRNCQVFRSGHYSDWSNSRVDEEAMAAHKRGDHQRSFELWRELVARRPTCSRCWNEMGDQAGFLKEFGRGLACNQKAQELGRGKSWFFWGNIATDYYHLGMAREGIDAYERYLQMMEQKKGQDWMERHEDSVQKAKNRIQEMREHRGNG